jgi:hypothetical protein
VCFVNVIPFVPQGSVLGSRIGGTLGVGVGIMQGPSLASHVSIVEGQLYQYSLVFADSIVVLILNLYLTPAVT